MRDPLPVLFSLVNSMFRILRCKRFSFLEKHSNRSDFAHFQDKIGEIRYFFLSNGEKEWSCDFSQCWNWEPETALLSRCVRQLSIFLSLTRAPNPLEFLYPEAPA